MDVFVLFVIVLLGLIQWHFLAWTLLNSLNTQTHDMKTFFPKMTEVFRLFNKKDLINTKLHFCYIILHPVCFILTRCGILDTSDKSISCQRFQGGIDICKEPASDWWDGHRPMTDIGKLTHQVCVATVRVTRASSDAWNLSDSGCCLSDKQAAHGSWARLRPTDSGTMF